jgi:hypothetical protein
MKETEGWLYGSTAPGVRDGEVVVAVEEGAADVAGGRGGPVGVGELDNDAALLAWGDDSHSAKGPGGQNQGVPEGFSAGYTGS